MKLSESEIALNTQWFIVSYARSLEVGSSGMVQWPCEVIKDLESFQLSALTSYHQLNFQVSSEFKMAVGAPVIISPF